MPIFSSKKKPNRQEILHRLSSYDLPQTAQQKLVELLEQASDDELFRVNPRDLTGRIGLGDREILNLFAAAFREGIFTLNWEIECPACSKSACYFRGPGDSYQHIECAACGNQFNAQFDNHVHVSFTVHPSVRTLSHTPQLGQALPMRPVNAAQPLSAHELLTVQGFRDFFKNEALPAGESFEVQRTTLLFTDLTGSTAMYVRKGDPNAYSLVRGHFDVLRKVVDEAGGAIVKTIGDAVMAVFLTEAAALRAALAARQQMDEFNHSQNLPETDLLKLKIGLHAGPSIYVTLDERLDYFGTTVNTAARVQAQAASDEIVFTDAILNAPGVRDLLQGQPLGETTVALKGLDGPVRLWHIGTPSVLGARDQGSGVRN